MQMHRITAPATNPDFTGPFNDAPDAPYFLNGTAYTDSVSHLAYFRQVGYGVTPVDQAPVDYQAAMAKIRAPHTAAHWDATAVPDPEQPWKQQRPDLIGTPLRDAAMNPSPGDASVPVLAGLVDPHSPLVVAPEALTREEQAAAAAKRADLIARLPDDAT